MRQYFSHAHKHNVSRKVTGQWWCLCEEHLQSVVKPSDFGGTSLGGHAAKIKSLTLQSF